MRCLIRGPGAIGGADVLDGFVVADICQEFGLTEGLCQGIVMSAPGCEWSGDNGYAGDSEQNEGSSFQMNTGLIEYVPKADINIIVLDKKG